MKDRIKSMMVDRLYLKMEPAEIANNKSLINDYGVDSLNLLELIVGIEEEFDLQIDDSEFRVSNFETVDALADFIQDKLNA